jgi:putative transposase
MNTRKIATEYRLSQWAKVVQQRIDSGKTIKDFCEDEGISRNTYFYWQKKLREAACKDLVTSEESSIVPNGWMQLQSNGSQYKGEGLAIEINGCQLKVDSNTDTELLKKVCRTLMSL